MSNNDKNYCDIKTSWDIKGSVCLKSVTRYCIETQEASACEDISHGSEQGENAPPASEVGLEIWKTSGDVPCQLFVSCQVPQHNFRLTAVDIVCDARHVEVFSDTGGYIASMRGIRIDEEIEVKHNYPIYLLQHSFEESVEKCQIKLVALSDQSKVWIHSLHLTLVPCKAVPRPMFPFQEMMMGPSIDMNKVKDLMKDMEGEVSSGAQGLMQNVEMFQKSKGGAAMMNPQMAQMMTMFSMMGDQPSNVTNPTPDSGTGNQQMGQMMAMFAAMGGGEQRIPNPEPNTQVKEENKLEESTGNEEKEAVLRSLSDPSNSDTEMFNALKAVCSSVTQNRTLGKDKEELKEEKADKPEENTESATNASHSSIGNPLLSACIPLLEGILTLQFQQFEQKMVEKVTQKISEAEDRLDKKLNKILALLEKTDNCS